MIKKKENSTWEKFCDYLEKQTQLPHYRHDMPIFTSLALVDVIKNSLNIESAA